MSNFLLNFILLLPAILPFALVLLTVFLLGFYLCKHRLPRESTLLWLSLLSMILGYLGRNAYTINRSQSRYHQEQSILAKNLDFTLYEPTYTIPGFGLVENEVGFVRSNYKNSEGGFEVDVARDLVFTYYDLSIKDVESNGRPKKFYIVRIQKGPAKPWDESVFGDSSRDGELLLTRNIDSTAIDIGGRGISISEANKVLDSLKKIDATKIKFRMHGVRY